MDTNLYQNSNSESRWTISECEKIINMPFMDLIFLAQKIHRENFNPSKIQISTLLSVKTGKCPENCSYCSQSAHYKTNIKYESLMDEEKILHEAKNAKANGSTRFCISAAWRQPNDKNLSKICNVITKIKKLGLETCATLGLLTLEQAQKLKSSGLDFYNHNIDTSKTHYAKIITTRTFEDRLRTLDNVRKSKINLCCGGIIGMGEKRKDRAEMLSILANMKPQPLSIPINKLIKITGTPLEKSEDISFLEIIRMISATRIILPNSYIRMSAGRAEMSYEIQAICFSCGVNSIFCGEKLLTTSNIQLTKDSAMFKELNLEAL